MTKAVKMTKEYQVELAKARARIAPSKGETIRDERRHHAPERVVMDGDREISREPWFGRTQKRRRA
jgi:hypothetical protein